MSDNTAEAIARLFEQLADRGGDITEQVFARYFARSPDAQSLMDHMDAYMRGRMMAQVLELLMEPGEAELESYIEFETDNHRGYGVTQHMYEDLFAAIREVLTEVLGPDLDPEEARAFDARVSFLLREIGQAA